MNEQGLLVLDYVGNSGNLLSFEGLLKGLSSLFKTRNWCQFRCKAFQCQLELP